MEVFVTFSVAVLSGVGAALLTHALRARYEDSRRWHGERRSIYARFLRICTDTYRFVDVVADNEFEPGEPPPGGIRVPSAGEETRLGAWLEEMEQVRNEISLVASESVKRAADDLARATDAVIGLIRGSRPRAPAELVESWHAARRAFEHAARKDLGISS